MRYLIPLAPNFNDFEVHLSHKFLYNKQGIKFYIHHFFEYTSKYITMLDMKAKYVTDVLIQFTQSVSVSDLIFYNMQFYSNKYNSQFDC